jgi:hypothetical protein
MLVAAVVAATAFAASAAAAPVGSGTTIVATELTIGVLAIGGGETRTDFAAGLIASKERTRLIDDLFNRYLRRDPLPVELSFWLGALGSGASDEDLAVSLVGSAESATTRSR